MYVPRSLTSEGGSPSPDMKEMLHQHPSPWYFVQGAAKQMLTSVV